MTQTKSPAAKESGSSALRHVWIGAGIALCAASVDAIVAVVRGEGAVLDGLKAWAHLVAFALPPGLIVGAAMAGASALFVRSDWTAGLRARMTRRRLFANDPRAVAGALALGACALAFLVGMRVLAEHFATRYHNPVLAAWAMAAASIVWLVVCALVALAVRELLLAWFAGLRISIRLGVVLSIAVLIGVLGLGVVIYVARDTLVHISVALRWSASLLAAYGLLMLLTRRRRMGVRSVVALGCLGVLITVANAVLYGGSSRVRGLVERRSDLGQSLVRFYLRVTDRDGDGHSFAYGGGDCDDSDALVYPGAFDPPGDGLDADCFDGDGTNHEVVSYTDGGFARVPASIPRRPNVVLVTVDALRFDRLGCGGYDKETSPRIDAFCEEAVVFEQPIAQSSRSIRSIPSMLSGRYPGEVAFGPQYLWPSLLEENVLLQERLGAIGYDTQVIMGTNYFDRIAGFFQGFDQVEQSRVYIPPRSWSIDRAIAALNRTDEAPPLFVWAHLFNVHAPYLHDGIPPRFGIGYPAEYDTEIALADEQFGRLLDAIEARGEEDETIVIFASDHGEALGEHDHRGHSETLYDEELGAVLMMRIPGVEPRRVSGRVGLLDLYPTVLNALRQRLPSPTLSRSLLPAALGEQPPSRPLFAELLPDGLFPFDQKAIYDGDEKLIWWLRDGSIQAFDLGEDPGELNDLTDERPELAQRLHRDLRAWLAQTGRRDNLSEAAIEDNRLANFPATIDQRLDVVYPGMFRLVGYDVNREVAPGDTIDVVLYFEVLGEMDEDLFFHLDIVGPSGRTHAEHFHGFHYPLNGAYRTFQWRAGERLRDPVPIVVPPNLAPVELDLVLTIFDERRRPVTGRSGGEEVHALEMGQVLVGEAR